MSIPMWRARSLTDLPHGFLGRGGGVSEGAMASLNCGWGSGDDKALIVAAAVLALAFASGCSKSSQASPAAMKADGKAKKELTTYNELVAASNFELAATVGRDLVKNYPGSPAAAEASSSTHSAPSDSAGSGDSGGSTGSGESATGESRRPRRRRRRGGSGETAGSDKAPASTES